MHSTYEKHGTNEIASLKYTVETSMAILLMLICRASETVTSSALPAMKTTNCFSDSASRKAFFISMYL